MLPAQIQNQKTMSSREVAQLTGKQHGHVCRDIELLNQTLEEESLSKIGESFYTAENGQTYREYLLTKEQTVDLMTGYSRNLRVRINRRWAELEAQQSIKLPNFTDPAEAAIAWAEQFRERQAAQEQLAIAAPKAAALDEIAAAQGSLNARDTAKTLSIKPSKFNAWAIAHGWMYRDSQDRLQPHSSRIQQGYMTIRPVTYHGSDGTKRATTQAMFTPKGLARLAEIFAIVREVA